MKLCSQCESVLIPGNRFCDKCGFDTTAAVAPPAPADPHPAQVPDEEPEPDTERKKRPVILLSVIAFCVLLAGAWYGYSRYHAGRRTSTLMPTEQAKPVTASPAAASPAAASPAAASPAAASPTAASPSAPGSSGAVNAPGILLSTGDKEGPSLKGPKNPIRLIIKKPTMILRITTDHFNGGKGTTLVGSLSIRDQNGKLIAAYSAIGKPDKNGVANALWTVEPKKILQQGIYYLWDSDLPSWSKNKAGEGVIVVERGLTN